jgi:hypothetical protein
MADRIRLRRDLASSWRAVNTVLTSGEPGFESDTNLLKIGDGTTPWNTLAYANRPDHSIAGGRLSVFQNVPVPINGHQHATPAAILYYVPHESNLIALWAGLASGSAGTWRIRAFDNSTAVSLVGLPANTNYDVFAHDSSGAVVLTLAPWADNWTRGSSLGLFLHQGVMVRTGDVTRRYLGTIRTSSTGGSTQDTQFRRFVWNYNHRILTSTLWISNRGHTYSSTAWRQWDNGSVSDIGSNSPADRIQRVVGTASLAQLDLISLIRYGNLGLAAYVFDGHNPTGAALTNSWANRAWNGNLIVTAGNNISPTQLSNQSATTVTFSRPFITGNVGLAEYWVAEQGLSANSYFFYSQLTVTDER